MSLATRFATALAVAAGLCLVPSSAAAQAVTGTLLGNIIDSSGAAVPGVTVTATEVQTNVGRTAVTNESGFGRYSSSKSFPTTIWPENVLRAAAIS